MSPKLFKIALCGILSAFFIFLMRSKYVMFYYNNLSIKQNLVLFDKMQNSQTILNLKYILLWSSISNVGEGTKIFKQRNCPYTNCYITSRRDFFIDIRNFNVVIFSNPAVNSEDLPKSRSLNQKYIFASTESSQYYPVCDEIFNDFFNWTWTYKLNSDVVYGYITIKDKKGNVIGPKEIMNWKRAEEMKAISEELKKKIGTKKYAVAWFASNCLTPSERELLVEQLKLELEQYELVLHVYGSCGQRRCAKYNMLHCLKKLETDYYFYLSFENSLCADYVTEKLLYALQHYAVPVVFGGANYTRYMPEGIYLDANVTPVSQLAKQIAALINDKEKYCNYFKWHNYYSYHDVSDSPASDPYCKLCSMINDEQRLQATSVYHNFIEWWSGNSCS